jgi:uncharacterized protein
MMASIRLAAALAALALCAAAPGPGFDCTRSTGAVERLICSDEGLARQDRALAERYEALRHAVSPESYAVLQKSQLTWLATRKDCVGKDKPHDQQVACLSDAYKNRTDDLGTQFKSSGGLSIEERVVARRLPRWRVDESDSYPYLVGTPETRADAFNRYISRRLKPQAGLFEASGMKLDSKPEGNTTFSRYYEVHRFDGAMISIKFYEFHESYFGHGWRSEFVINWDPRHDRPLSLDDIFDPKQDWQQIIYDYAMKSLHEGGDISNPENWFSSPEVVDDDAWLFDADGAVLLFGHGERSMVGASADVPIPYDVLQPLLRPGTPVIPPETK